MSDDTPTQRFEVQEDLQEEKQKSRGLMIGLIAAAALLIATLIVLVIILLPKGSADPQAGDTQTPESGLSETPTPEPTVSDVPTPDPTPTEDAPAPPPPPPPPATGAAFTTFSPKSQVSCSRGGPGFTPDPPSIEISWATVRADSAWIVQGTSDAADSGFMQIPLNGNQSNFQYTLQFPCFQANATYTITLVGSDGNHVSKSWTVKNIGDKD
jgi:hypothetical protein